jgi:isopenicillin-N epimerase
MLDLDVDGLGAAYYVGNCHKWLCAPKGAGILWVRADRRAAVQPTTISHGANAVDGTRTRFRLEFDWTGTDDPTAALCVPVSIATLEGLVPGGWPAIRAHNHALALEGRDILVEALGLERPPVPAARIGAMVALPLAGPLSDRPSGPFGTDPLQDELWERHRIEVPVFPFRPAGRRMIRISAQIYNSADQYRRLAAALRG